MKPLLHAQHGTPNVVMVPCISQSVLCQLRGPMRGGQKLNQQTPHRTHQSSWRAWFATAAQPVDARLFRLQACCA
jgi:hypothetical protein